MIPMENHVVIEGVGYVARMLSENKHSRGGTYVDDNGFGCHESDADKTTNWEITLPDGNVHKAQLFVRCSEINEMAYGEIKDDTAVLTVSIVELTIDGEVIYIDDDVGCEVEELDIKHWLATAIGERFSALPSPSTI